MKMKVTNEIFALTLVSLLMFSACPTPNPPAGTEDPADQLPTRTLEWTAIAPVPSGLEAARDGMFIDDSTYYLTSWPSGTTTSSINVSIDGGATWSPIALLKNAAPVNITSFYANGLNLFAGSDQGLFVSQNGGTSWVNYTTTNGLGSNTVNALVVSGSSIWLATAYGLAYSANGGVTWTNQTSLGTSGVTDLKSIAVSGSTWCVGWVSGISVSTNSGSTWTEYNSLNGFAGSADGGILISGATIVATGDLGVSISSNSGSTWVTRTTADGLASNATSSPRLVGGFLYVCISLAGASKTQAGYAVSSDNGATWTNHVWTVFPATSQCLEVSGAKLSLLLGDGLLRVSSDNGWVWSLRREVKVGSISSSNIRAVAASGSHVYVVDGTQNDSKTLDVSQDSGVTWSILGKADGVAQGTAVAADGQLVAVTTVDGIAVSTDAGATFLNHASYSATDLTSFGSVVALGQTIAALKSTTIVVSIDSGATWSSHSTADGYTISGMDVRSSTQLRLIEGTLYLLTPSGLSVSTDKGATWNHKAMPDGTDFGDFYIKGLHAFAIADYWNGVVVEESTDGGITWQARTDLGRPAALFGDTSILITLGGQEDPKIWMSSTDGGNTWSTWNSGNGVGIDAVSGTSLFSAFGPELKVAR